MGASCSNWWNLFACTRARLQVGKMMVVLDTAARPTGATRSRQGKRANGRHQCQQHQQHGLQGGVKTEKSAISSGEQQSSRRPTSSCDTLIVNNQTIDFRLRWVERCLTYLVEEESIRELQDGAMSTFGYYKTNWRERLYRDQARIKAMLMIYAKLLRCPPPLDLVMPKLASPKHVDCIHDARQHVLSD